MSKRISPTDRDELLRLVAGMGSYGRAESEPEDGFLKRYLPLPEHARCLDPEVVLIIGDRGAGKTELFRAIQFPEGLEHIQRLGGGVKLPEPSRSRWVVGYSSTGTQFPPEDVLRTFAVDKEPSDLRLAWMGLLLRALHQIGFSGSEELPPAVVGEVARPTPRLSNLHGAIADHVEFVFEYLDRADAHLLQEDSWVFVTYDELDRVSAGDWEQLQKILRGLVQFWASYVRRWRRLRPKVFLRRDLFNRAALFGPDVSKIAAQRVELVWSVKNLYGLIAKRLLNQDGRLSTYFDGYKPQGEIRGALGWYPTGRTENDFRKLVERICGRHMGAGPAKGMSFTWIPNHLQDGNGHVLPRSLVRLFECAADIELADPKAETPQLLHHTSLRGAVDRVSEDRVREMEDEEFAWIRHVRTALQRVHPNVPIERHDLEKYLHLDWRTLSEKPPDTSSRELLRYLVELGIFYERGDRRIDVRDLYLKGFGLRRKGGVKRPY